MPCPRCGSSGYRSGDLRCPDCPYEVCIGPGSDIDRYELPPARSPIKAPISEITEFSWKDICPQCKKQTFDGWDCDNPNCKYGIPEKARKMHGQILSPEESARLREELDIP